MKLIIRLAIRNLFRHKARFILNLCLLIGAFLALVTFKGFQKHILGEIQETVITSQTGHLQIAKAKMFDLVQEGSKKSTHLQDAQVALEKIRQIPGVKFAAPRLTFFGLTTFNDQSVPTRFASYDFEAEGEMQDKMLFNSGRHVSAAKEALVGVGLAESLRLKENDEITLVTADFNGGMNAMDLKVVGTVTTGMTEIDDSTVFMNIKDAQKVLDTDLVDRIVIRADSLSLLPNLATSLAPIAQSIDSEIRNWKQLAILFNQVEDFYNMQNMIVEVALILLLFLSISNTLNMNVHDRIAEIGTCKALGDTEWDMAKLVIFESLAMALISILIAIPVVWVSTHLLSSLKIPISLPLASIPIPLEIDADFVAYFQSATTCFIAVMLSAVWPARTAAKCDISSALRAKI